MAFWTYVHGTVTVQAEKNYCEKALDNLPFVTGLERNMDIYIIQKNGYNNPYSIWVVDGILKDRMFSQTYKEFQEWLRRLSKSVHIEDVLVEVAGQEQSVVIREFEEERMMIL